MEKDQNNFVTLGKKQIFNVYQVSPIFKSDGGPSSPELRLAAVDSQDDSPRGTVTQNVSKMGLFIDSVS
jgi:hypothetical protein